MRLLQKGGIIVHSSVYLPENLHRQARESGINLSATLRAALEEKLRSKLTKEKPDHQLPHMGPASTPG